MFMGIKFTWEMTFQISTKHIRKWLFYKSLHFLYHSKKNIRKILRYKYSWEA